MGERSFDGKSWNGVSENRNETERETVGAEPLPGVGL